jgi:hypothetical protein
MKMILLFACVLTLFTATGCFSPGHRGHWGVPADATAAPPAVAGAGPEVIVMRQAGKAGALENILP